jgi:hypothetical protein
MNTLKELNKKMTPIYLRKIFTSSEYYHLDPKKTNRDNKKENLKGFEIHVRTPFLKQRLPWMPWLLRTMTFWGIERIRKRIFPALHS